MPRIDPASTGLLVTPVDAPLVGAATVRQLLAAISNRHLPLVRATHNGRHGHPVVFARKVFDELRHADPGVGARAIVRRYVLRGMISKWMTPAFYWIWMNPRTTTGDATTLRR